METNMDQLGKQRITTFSIFIDCIYYDLMKRRFLSNVPMQL